MRLEGLVLGRMEGCGGFWAKRDGLEGEGEEFGEEGCN